MVFNKLCQFPGHCGEVGKSFSRRLDVRSRVQVWASGKQDGPSGLFCRYVNESTASNKFIKHFSLVIVEI